MSELANVITAPARRMEIVPVSGISKMFERAKALQSEGKPVVFMETGRPDFDTPAHIKEAAKKALDEGRVHYTSHKGIPELRQAIADKFAADNGICYDPAQEIMVTVGAAEAVLDAFLALLDPGDEVLVPEPSWLNYSAAARIAGAIPISVPLRESNNYQIAPADVARLITPRTRILVIISPHNPTGAVQRHETLAALAELAEKHNLIIVSDEIYEKITYDGVVHESIATFPGMRERCIVINGFSKAYSMTGWRLGYMGAPSAIVREMHKVHQYNTACACSFAQYGALAALKGPQDCVKEMVSEFKRRRDLIVGSVQSTPGLSCNVPTGAFYVFLNITGLGMSSEEFATRLLEEEYVSTVPGTVFGEPGTGFVRISYATSYERIEQAMERLDRFAHSNT